MKAVREQESGTRGEIRVHVKPRCGGDVMKEARRTFEHLRMHRTKEHNAVLIFVATRSRRFAIVGDEGIHNKVGDAFWQAARDAMSRRFAEGDIPGGIAAGVRCVGEKLREHFPGGRWNDNELSDNVTGG